MSKWGGNFNCIYCISYEKDCHGKHKCKRYKTKLGKGRVLGIWVLPCIQCHKDKNYGDKNNGI